MARWLFQRTSSNKYSESTGIIAGEISKSHDRGTLLTSPAIAKPPEMPFILVRPPVASTPHLRSPKCSQALREPLFRLVLTAERSINADPSGLSNRQRVPINFMSFKVVAVLKDRSR